jgi:hypothetical protein
MDHFRVIFQAEVARCHIDYSTLSVSDLRETYHLDIHVRLIS